MRAPCVLLCAMLLGVANARSGYVDLGRLVREHPLYPQLVHYDRAIAALQATQRAWSASVRRAAIAGDRRALQQRFSSASQQMLTLSRANAGTFEQRERNGLGALSDEAAHTAANPSEFAASEKRTYDAMRAHRNAGLARYRDDLLREEQRMIVQARQSFHRRAQDAYDLRTAQLRESESELGLELTRRDAHRILMLRLRIDALQLPADQRRAATAQLTALLGQESARLQVKRAADGRVLADYRRRTVREASAQANRLIARIRERTQANFAARVAALHAQASEHAVTLPTPAAARSAGLGTEVAALQRSLPNAFATQVDSTNRAFADARTALGSEFAAVAAVDDSSTDSVAAQIRELERERAAARSDIAAWIMRDAERVASERGIANVRTSRRAGAVDLTSAVERLICQTPLQRGSFAASHSGCLAH
jgi:hypothetical protein